jgi:hypothetical protein
VVGIEPLDGGTIQACPHPPDKRGFSRAMFYFSTLDRVDAEDPQELATSSAWTTAAGQQRALLG